MNYSEMNTGELISLYKENTKKADEKKVLQKALKNAINSLYGALANKFFPMFNQDMARSITGNGRFFINLTGSNVDKYLHDLAKSEKPYWIYSDTDSCYFALNKIGDALSKDKNLRDSKNTINEFIESKIQPKVEESILEMKEVFNAVDDQKIGMKREVIFKGAVWLAKKKYFMRELDSEGIEYLDEDNPEIKKQGIEIVKSSTPPFSRKYLNDATLIILEKDKDTLKKFLQEVRQKFTCQKLMDIAKTSSVNSLDYDLDNDKFDENGRKISIPINSRSVLVTNRYIKENNLQLEHNLLTENEKIKMLYLKMPNPLNSDSFAFNTEKFAQLFKDYIDYDTNFEKLFLKPLELMTENLNYDLKNNNEVLDEW